MTTIILQDNIKLEKTNFVNINELKIFIYESFWYPNINSDLEEKWYKNWKLDLCEDSFSSIEDMKKCYINLRK